MHDRIELSLLLDYYGAFLTENQRELIELSCDDDLSLSEIAEQKGISRQGVRDAITRGEKSLSEMESKLGLIARDRRVRALIGELQSVLVDESAEPEQKLRTVNTGLSEISDIMEGKDGV